LSARLHSGGTLAFFLLSAIPVIFAISSPARAQADLNLQSRIQTFSAPIAVPRPRIADGKDSIKVEGKCISKNDPALRRIALKYHNKMYPPVKEDYYDSHPDKVVDDIENYFSKPPSRGGRKGKLAPFPYQPPNLSCSTEQPTSLTVGFPFNPTYETNVLRSNTNISSDTSLGFGGSILMTAAGFKDRPFDLIAFGASSASARYSAFPSKSLDTITEQGFYQIFLDAYAYHYGDGTLFYIHPKSSDIPSPNMITVDTLSLGFQNQTAFTPGIRVETADLLTPQITLARQNISLLGGNQDNRCSASSAGSFGFCHYADLSLTIGQTSSDVLTQQNASLTASGTLGWRFDNSDWKLTIPAVATAREYENVIGGRQDVLVQIGPVLTYTRPPRTPDEPSIMLSLAMTYNQNYSTVSAAAWHGVIIQPTLSLAFTPPIAFNQPEASTQ
jgi:hypothetical protein